MSAKPKCRRCPNWPQEPKMICLTVRGIFAKGRKVRRIVVAVKGAKGPE